MTRRATRGRRVACGKVTTVGIWPSLASVCPVGAAYRRVRYEPFVGGLMDKILLAARWSMATRHRFTLIWGVCVFGGLASVITPILVDDWPPRPAWLIVVPLWMIGGYLWGMIMWAQLRFAAKRRLARMSQTPSGQGG